MSTSTYPTLFKRAIAASLAATLLAACATIDLTPATQSAPAVATPTPVPLETAVPHVFIRNQSAKAILDNIIKYRTQKGMKVVSRESNRVVLGITIPKSNPPAEARMIYSISPAADSLRLSAQVFQITRQDGKAQSAEITDSLRDNIEEELETYTH